MEQPFSSQESSNAIGNIRAFLQAKVSPKSNQFREQSITDMIDIVSTDQNVIFPTPSTKNQYLNELATKIEKNFVKAEETEKEKIMKIVMRSKNFHLECVFNHFFEEVIANDSGIISE